MTDSPKEVKEGTPDALPVQIRHKAQDWESRWLEDPRREYIQEFNAEHAHDDFVAVIPAEYRLRRMRRTSALLLSAAIVAGALLTWRVAVFLSVL